MRLMIVATSFLSALANGEEKITDVTGTEIDIPKADHRFTRRAYKYDRDIGKVVILLEDAHNAAPKYDGFVDTTGFTLLKKDGRKNFVFTLSDNGRFDSAQLEVIGQVERYFGAGKVGSGVKNGVADRTMKVRWYTGWENNSGKIRVMDVTGQLHGLDTIDASSMMFSFKREGFGFALNPDQIIGILLDDDLGVLNGKPGVYVGKSKLTFIPGFIAAVDQKLGLLKIADLNGNVQGQPIDVGQDNYVRAKLKDDGDYSMTTINVIKYIADEKIELGEEDATAYGIPNAYATDMAANLQ